MTVQKIVLDSGMTFFEALRVAGYENPLNALGVSTRKQRYAEKSKAISKVRAEAKELIETKSIVQIAPQTFVVNHGWSGQ